MPTRPTRPIVHSVSGNYFLFGLNLGIPPLDNKQVRQALNYALDRKRFVDTFMFGTGTAESLPWPTELAGVRGRQAELLRVRPGQAPRRC